MEQGAVSALINSGPVPPSADSAAVTIAVVINDLHGMSLHADGDVFIENKPLVTIAGGVILLTLESYVVAFLHVFLIIHVCQGFFVTLRSQDGETRLLPRRSGRGPGKRGQLAVHVHVPVQCEREVIGALSGWQTRNISLPPGRPVTSGM